MPKHAWTIVCQRAVVDRFTNQISLFDLIEEIQTIKPAAPANAAGASAALPVRWYVASLWERSIPDRPEKVRSRCRVYAPDGKKVAQLEQDINLEDHPKMRGLMQLPLLVLRGDGTYRFVIYCGVGKKWRRVSEIPVGVRYIEPPKTAKVESKKAHKKASRSTH